MCGSSTVVDRPHRFPSDYPAADRPIRLTTMRNSAANIQLKLTRPAAVETWGIPTASSISSIELAKTPRRSVPKRSRSRRRRVLPVRCRARWRRRATSAPTWNIRSRPRRACCSRRARRSNGRSRPATRSRSSLRRAASSSSRIRPPDGSPRSRDGRRADWARRAGKACKARRSPAADPAP